MTEVHSLDPAELQHPNPEGISRSGNYAEERFRHITGASTVEQSSDGDAVLGGYLVEIKQASSPTINQVRAVKYLPLVVYNPKLETWYVVPPDEVIRLVALKRRGQHTENPFECASLSASKIAAYLVGEEELRSEVLDAIEQGEAKTGLKQAMETIRLECKDLAQRSRRLVKEALESGL